MAIPTTIDLVLRIPNGAPLTAAEMDNNLAALRTAILSLSAVWLNGRVVFGDEPVAGERDNVLWVPTDPADGIGAFRWDTATTAWIRVSDPPLFATSTGATDAYALTIPFTAASYADLTGKIILMSAHAANTGAATLVINTLGTAIAITKAGTTALVAGDIAINSVAVLVYDGTRFQLLNPMSPPVIPAQPTYWQYPVADDTVIELPSTSTCLTYTIPDAAGKPHQVRMVLLPKTGETDYFDAGGTMGYVETDEVDATSLCTVDSGGNQIPAFSLISNSTSVSCVVLNAGQGFHLAPKSSPIGDHSLPITPSKWRIRFYGVTAPATT